MDYLPIGSIVRLKNGITKLMIIGYCKLIKEDQTKINDYVAVTYPLGLTSMNKLIAFKKDDIDVVITEGIKDEEYKQLIELMNKKNA